MARGQLHDLACRGEPGRRFFVYIPSRIGHETRIFVDVHGISRNVEEHVALFSKLCEIFGAILVAPAFTPEASQDYQRLGREGRGPRADLALNAILEDVAWFTGVSTERIHLFGFSGGAQFAHRYAMAHPHRVAAAVIGASGWYTFPDPAVRYPYGIRRTRELPGVRFDPEEFLRVPMTVMVGSEDVTDVDLRNTARVNEQQGKNRVERARNWVEAMRSAARDYHLEPLVELETIPGGDHVFAKFMQEQRLGDRVFAALFGGPRGNGERNGHEHS